MSTPNPAHTASTQIDSLISALETMVDTLGEERHALSSADASALEDIAERKALAVEKISHLYENFKQGLGLDDNHRAQASPGRSFTEALSNIRVKFPQMADRLDHLVTLTRACRQSNQDNGTLVNLGMQNCKASLNLLQGLGPQPQVGIYGPGAQPEDSFSSLQRLQLRA